MPIKLVIAEDQRLFRQSLRLLLEQERDLRVVGEAADGQEAFSLVQQMKPDLVLMDVDMPKLDGIAATRLIREQDPGIKVLMLSVHDDDMRIVSAIQAGARGYILKDADHAEFLRIIRGTYHNQEVSSPFLADRLAQQAHHRLERARGALAEQLATLTEREQEILACVAAGKGNKAIAERMCVSLDTVKTHLHHTYQKLGVTSRIEAVLIYLNATPKS
ncbi:MAG: response regulator transcription factor [Nitrospinae bacterium]|nr:response regulator transcription factor [Nitrospinota bacterium]